MSLVPGAAMMQIATVLRKLAQQLSELQKLQEQVSELQKLQEQVRRAELAARSAAQGSEQNCSRDCQTFSPNLVVQ